MKVSYILASGLLLASTVYPLPALASPGYIPANVNLRAGPGTMYPVVKNVPRNVIIEINGCLKDGSWCDITWARGKKNRDEHGWVAGRYLQSAYRKHGEYYIRPYEPIRFRVTRFDIVSYWDTYYRHEYFYRNRNRYMRHDERRWDRDDRQRDRDWDERQSDNRRYDRSDRDFSDSPYSSNHWNN